MMSVQPFNIDSATGKCPRPEFDRQLPTSCPMATIAWMGAGKVTLVVPQLKSKRFMLSPTRVMRQRCRPQSTAMPESEI